MQASRTTQRILRFVPKMSFFLLLLVVGLTRETVAQSATWGQLGRYPAPDYYVLQSEN